ncbi:putative cation exchanger C521.04c isoform X1 [Gopherus evgoodei]|uniref:putative cation exchanger C521.04c isoform X1 n=1 Tax=Gopherus evgoodei TaxID=1825980 RepID=UPI0011CF1BB3|nr:putative cation exchanger C521.04c isoform X1 [Gopherus evgoodei]
MSSGSDPGRRRRYTHDTFDFPKEFEHRVDPHRRGSLCDRHCAAINNIHGDLGDMHSGSHQHSIMTPRILPVISTPPCCQHLSDEVQICDGCLVKTTITAENEVEANKLSNNYKFGFKKWKSHVTARPWEDRSEIVKELYSDLNVVKSPRGSTVTCGNILYLLLFGWWLSLLYLLVSALMFLTVLGAPYGKLCWDLAGYFFWPFGKVIQKTRTYSRKCSIKFNKCEVISEVNEAKENTPLLSCHEVEPGSHADATHWRRVSTYIWLLLGYPVLALAHGLVCFVAWLLVFIIPVAKMNARTVTEVLLLAPEHVHIQRMRKTEVPLEAEVVLCCYRAVNAYYYKYAVDGINVFAVNLLPLVIVTLVLGYVDSHNRFTSSPVKFTLSLLSIMPLSYYIGMAIASISAQSNFAVGAVVNASFGSIIELTFYITALIKGSREGNKCYEEIVKSALTGTLLGCVLLVPGLCMVIGGIRHQEQRFNSRSAGVSSALLFLSVGGVFAPTLFSKVYGRLVCGECQNITQSPEGHYLCQNCHFDLMENNGTLYYKHVQPLVYTVSLVLPAAYIIGLFFTLKTHSHIYDIHISDCPMPGHHHSAVVHWSRCRALIILLLSTLCMSACADLATEHISPILTNSTVSQYFIGVTVLAMVPELPEIVNGIQFALQNNLSLSIEIGSCIAVQVCMLQIPILVLFTVFYPTGFILVFSDLHVYSSMFSVVLMNYIFMDGKCDYFQGTVLVMVYVILLAVYFFAPSPAGC